MSEKKIIATLSSASAEPSTYFKENLRRKVINISKQETKVMEKVSVFSRFKLAPVIGVLLLSAVGVGALMNNQSSDGEANLAADEARVTQESAGESADASMSMIAPTSQLDSVADARAAVDFNLLLPDLIVGSEEIIRIEQYDGGNGNALTFIYGSGDATMYRFSARPISETYYDEAAESKTLSYAGASVTAHYSYFGEPSEDEAVITLDGGEMARSMLTWDTGGVVYEILEYGGVSEAQLIQLAESLK